MRKFNVEFVIDVLEGEEDRLYDKLNSTLSGELLEDFKVYTEIKFSLLKFKEELSKLRESF